MPTQIETAIERVVRYPDDNSRKIEAAKILLANGAADFGNLIKIQSALEHSAIIDCPTIYTVLKSREQELLGKLPTVVDNAIRQYRRGFVYGITTATGDFLKNHENLFNAHPIQKLHLLIDSAAEFQEILNKECLKKIKHLVIDCRDFPILPIMAVSENQNLQQLEKLELILSKNSANSNATTNILDKLPNVTSLGIDILPYNETVLESAWQSDFFRNERLTQRLKAIRFHSGPISVNVLEPFYNNQGNSALEFLSFDVNLYDFNWVFITNSNKISKFKALHSPKGMNYNQVHLVLYARSYKLQHLCLDSVADDILHKAICKSGMGEPLQTLLLSGSNINDISLKRIKPTWPCGNLITAGFSGMISAVGVENILRMKSPKLQTLLINSPFVTKDEVREILPKYRDKFPNLSAVYVNPCNGYRETDNQPERFPHSLWYRLVAREYF